MKAKTFKWRHALWLAIFLFSLLCQGQNAMAQEIPNGDGDLLWERPLNGRTVNDAKFHPINGNIIAAMDNEIWEIDPKDGHTIRVFEGPLKIDEDMYLSEIDISPDGNSIVTNGLQYYSGIYFWDYNEGKLIDSLNYFSLIGRFYPDNETMLFWARSSPGGIEGGLVKYNYKSKKVILEKEIGYEKYLQLATLSRDGKYLPIGLYNKGSVQFSMELWDAETLTKIKDFGSPGEIHEFRDVQISDDNQYVGFLSDGGNLHLFNIIELQLINHFSDAYCLAFTPDSKKLAIEIDTTTAAFGSIAYLMDIKTQSNIYSYTLTGGFFRINFQNEILTYGWNSKDGLTLKLISNRWYEVGVNSPFDLKIGISNTSYKNNSLQIITEGIEIINTLMITDTLGKKIYFQNEIPVINNQTTIPLFLPSGNYLLKIISNGKEYTSKFVVVR